MDYIDLNRIIEKLNLTFPVAEISEKTGYSKGAVSNYLSKRQKPSKAFIKKFLKVFNIPLEMYFQEPGTTFGSIKEYEFLEKKYNKEISDKLIKDLKKTADSVNESFPEYNSPKKGLPFIPLNAVAGNGNGDMQILESDIIDRYVIPDFERKGVDFIIQVSGSSMYPKYSSGDLLGCKLIKDTSFFQWGRPYVLDTDQGVMVKRLFPVEGDENKLECRSDNKNNYPPFVISKDSIYKISIVIGVVRLD